jgi:hypothetical protein
MVPRPPHRGANSHRNLVEDKSADPFSESNPRLKGRFSYVDGTYSVFFVTLLKNLFEKMGTIPDHCESLLGHTTPLSMTSVSRLHPAATNTDLTERTTAEKTSNHNCDLFWAIYA